MNIEQSILESALTGQDIPSTEQDKELKTEAEELNSNQFSYLSELFNPSILSKLTLSDLGKPLSEIISRFSKSEETEIPITVKDVDNLTVLELNYSLSDSEVAKYLETIQPKEDDLKLSININNKVWDLTYRYELSDKTKLEDIKELLTNNYYLKLQSEKLDDEGGIDSEVIQSLDDTKVPVSAFMVDKEYFIKVPIAKKGKYYHPIYKVLDFDEVTLQTIENNINENIVGYPIPITLGHIDEGGSKEGELVKVYREGDILYGEWSVNKTTYRKVEDGDITFSSAEFYPKYYNKFTGEEVGRTLFGMALTNRPYVPNQPKVLTLSDKTETESYCVSTKLNYGELQYNDREVLSNSNLDKKVSLEENTMPDDNKEKETLNEMPIQLSDQVKVLQEQLSDYQIKLSEVEKNYQQKLSDQEAINLELQTKIQKYEDRIKEEEINAKLNYLSELNLPKDIHEKYSDLIKNESLGDSEELVLSSLATLALQSNAQVLSQYGYSKSTADLNSEKFADPYAKVIEYNKKLAETKKAQTLAMLNS